MLGCSFFESFFLFFKFNQLPASKKMIKKNRASLQTFGPSYFVRTLVENIYFSQNKLLKGNHCTLWIHRMSLENKVLQKLKLSKNVLPNYYVFLIEKKIRKTCMTKKNHFESQILVLLSNYQWMDWFLAKDLAFWDPDSLFWENKMFATKYAYRLC